MKLRLEESDMVMVGNGASRAELISDLLLNAFQESVVVFVPVGTANAGEENEPPLLPGQLHSEGGFSRTFKGLNPACSWHGRHQPRARLFISARIRSTSQVIAALLLGMR